MSCCFARNNLSSEIRRNLDGNYTETKSLTKILTENAQQYVASIDEFNMDRIGDARNLNKNL